MVHLVVSVTDGTLTDIDKIAERLILLEQTGKRERCGRIRARGGESADQVGARAVKVIERVRAVLPHGDVILVGHGHFNRVLVAGWIGLPVPSGVHFRLGRDRGARGTNAGCPRFTA